MFFHKILQLHKFQGVDFKYDNIVFKFQPKKYPNKEFLVPNLGIFSSAPKCVIRQTRGRWSQLYNNTFKSQPKIPESSISGPKFKDFHFCTKLSNYANSKTLISNVTAVFKIVAQNTQYKLFLVADLRIFIFTRNFITSKVCY